MRSKQDQGEVWKEVAVAQMKLADSVGTPVAAPESKSSFQLTLENKAVQENSDQYVKALAGVIEGKQDVIGYAFAFPCNCC